MRIRKYQAGLQAIRDTKQDVAKLQVNITEYQPKLKLQQIANTQLQQELEIKTKEAEFTE